MGKSKFHLRTSRDSLIATGSSGKYALTIDRSRSVITLDRPHDPSRKGLGYTGGDLFQLALAGCFTGDIMSEAERHGTPPKHVDVDIETDWGPNNDKAESLNFSVKVEADASKEEILDLIKWADNDSTISRTVRTGVPFTLSSTIETLAA